MGADGFIFELDMATIITQPDSLSLASNIKKFEIAATSNVSFRLSIGVNTLIDEVYTPNALGRVVIDIKEIILSNLALTLPSSNIFQQTGIFNSFTAEIDELDDVVFSVIRSGVEKLADTPINFLAANWLTWQPQTKQTGYYQPEWLTYYAPVAGVVKVKYYLSNDTSTTLTLHNISANTCYSYNMQFAHIMSLQAGDKYGYFDVWVEDTLGVRLTYIQRYIYKEAEADDEYFVFENSLGGLDTAVMTGASAFIPEVEHIEGLYNEESEQLKGSLTRLYTKDTGFKSKTEAAWLWDFFASVNKYKVQDGSLVKITVRESDIQDSTEEDLKAFTFKYRLSVDQGLLNIERSADPLPDNLEILTPEGLFFLAPRLNEFPSAELDNTLIFPVQSPFSEIWKKLSWGAIWNFLYTKILESAIGIMAHIHDNLSVLNKLSETNGKLQYDGAEIGTGSGSSVALGETSTTAYRGDRGKIAYEHSQSHHVTEAPENSVIYGRKNKSWVTIVQGGASVRLSTDHQVFEYDAEGNLIDARTDAWIFATLINITGDNIYYEWLVNNVSLFNVPGAYFQYLPPETYSAPDVVKVIVRVGGPAGTAVANDTISMYGVKPGSDGTNGKDAYTLVFSNPFHGFPATENGIVTDYSYSGTDIKVYRGAVLVPYGTGPNTFDVAATGTDITPGVATTVDTYIRRFANCSNMTAIKAKIDFVIKVRDAAGIEVILHETQTFTISKKGDPGENGGPGPVGPSLVWMGDYNSGTTYIGSAKRIDCVYYPDNGKYYSALRTAGSFSGKNPIDSQYWEIADGQFKFIATELLLAKSTYIKNLIAEQLKTAESGKRIEVNAGDKQEVAIYDASGNLKFLIKPEPISSLAAIQAGTDSISPYVTKSSIEQVTNSFYYADYQSQGYISETVNQYSSAFDTGTLTGLLEISISNITAQVGISRVWPGVGNLRLSIWLQKEINSVWVRIQKIDELVIQALTSNASDTKSVSKVVSGLSSGNYRFEVEHYHFLGVHDTAFPGDIPSVEVLTASSVEYTSGSSFTVTVTKVLAQTEIGTDGMASIFASNKYFHFSQNGLFAKMGTKTLEITDSSFKINGIEQ